MAYTWQDGELVTAAKLNNYGSGLEEIKEDCEDAQGACEDAQTACEAATVHQPIVQNGTWWTWNQATSAYVDTGVPATGQTTAVVTYQEGTSGTVAPTGSWSPTVPTVAQGNYLWTKTVFNELYTTYSVARQGVDGSGAVTSVNGMDGVVVLDTDDISDTDCTHKWSTQAINESAHNHNNKNLLDDISSSDVSNWNGKSVVSVEATGTATDEVGYITVNGVEKKLAGGFSPQIVVTAPTGSTVTCTKGSTVLTATEVSGTWTFNVTEYGTWTIQATKGTSSKEVSVVVDSVKQFDVEIQYYHVWTVSINQANSNPETACTYTDDAVGMTPGSSEWDTLFKYRPCLLVNGVVNKYLNPNNYAQDIDGNAVDITTVGNDVMVEFPKMGYKITTSGDTTLVQVTDNPNADGFCYKPFSRNAIGDRDFFYYGAYKSYSTGNKLYSSSGKTPTANKTRAAYRSEATARGTGYFQNGFYQLIFLQCLYILKYKNLNSQSALGYGYVGGSSAQSTGATNAKGMCYGNTSSQTDRMKLFGIEDFWGNIWQWFDGLTTDASRNLIVTHLPVNFDDATSGTAHTSYTSGISSNIGGYMDKVQGGTDTGFVAKSVSGSDSTYFTDSGFLHASCVAMFGGRWNDALKAGVFPLLVAYAASRSDSDVASRLMYV